MRRRLPSRSENVKLVPQGFFDAIGEWRSQTTPDSVFLGEFGCARRVPGAAGYLADVVSLANRAGWHWCFYAFREDEWDGMDYEIGSKPLPARYWQAVGRGESVAPPRDSGNPLWGAIRRGLAAK